MRILIVSFDTIPGYSGGFTTNVDLISRDHELTWVTGRLPGNITHIEGMKTYKPDYSHGAFKDFIKHMFQEGYDFCLCLGDRESAICQELGIPYMTRYHTIPFDSSLQLAYKVKKDAFWTIENHHILPKDLIDTVIPHAIDPERYADCYQKHLETDYTQIRFVLLATLNWVEDPFTFIKACKQAKVQGWIIGDGVLRQEVITRCALSRGYCTYIGAVSHADLPKRLLPFAVGVSTLSEKSPNKSLLKCIEYAAAGLTIIQPAWADQEIPCWIYDSTKRLIDTMKGIQIGSPHGFDDKVVLKLQHDTIIEKYNARTWAEVFNRELETRYANRT